MLNLPPLLKVRCCRPKKFGRLPEGLHNNPSLRITLQNRTIPLAFRRVSVCVCLVGFASLQSPWAHTLKASLPLYERSVGFASLQSLWAFISGILALLAPPVAPNTVTLTIIAKGQQPLSPHQHSCLLMNALLVLHPHYPLLCTTTLASLVKGEVLSPEKNRATTGGIAQQPLSPHKPPKTALSPERALYPFTTQPFLHILDISFYPCYTFISVSEN